MSTSPPVSSDKFIQQRDLGPFGVESFSAAISASAELIRLSDEDGSAIRLNVREAAVLRDWLNKVLPL